MAVYEDNLESFLREMDDQLLTQDHELVQANNMEYAEHLHNREGYSVFNPQHVMKTTEKWLRDVIASDKPLNDKNAVRALDAAGHDDINYLRSYIGEFKPPVKAGEGVREKHPGEWSDVTGNLKAAYQHQVNSGPVRTDKDYE